MSLRMYLGLMLQRSRSRLFPNRERLPCWDSAWQGLQWHVGDVKTNRDREIVSFPRRRETRRSTLPLLARNQFYRAGGVRIHPCSERRK